jgi:hypothetical protein
MIEENVMKTAPSLIRAANQLDSNLEQLAAARILL